MTNSKRLDGQVALVTGASRGIGRGIALQLGEAGAKVYITGRSAGASLSSSQDTLPSLEQTAEDISKRGGDAVCIHCDHTNDEDVSRLFSRLEQETGGNLDILVNNVYAGVPAILKNAGRKFYECEPALWDEINNAGLRNHYVCSVHAARIMSHRSRGGLIVNISSGGGIQYFMNVPYGVGKAALDRMSADMGLELKKSKIAVVSLWPGVVKTEISEGYLHDVSKITALCKAIGISEETFLRQVAAGETPEFVGRAVVGLATDQRIMKKSGRIHITADLAREYRFKDINGTMPANMRSVRGALEFFGMPRLARLVPSFIRIPKPFLHFAAYKF